VKALQTERTSKGLPFPDVRLSVVDTTEEQFIPISGLRGYEKGTFPVPDLVGCKGIADGFAWPLVVKRLFRDSRDDKWNDPHLIEQCANGISPEFCQECAYRH
jgi:hypothetical protein